MRATLRSGSAAHKHRSHLPEFALKEDELIAEGREVASEGELQAHLFHELKYIWVRALHWRSGLSHAHLFMHEPVRELTQLAAVARA